MNSFQNLKLTFVRSCSLVIPPKKTSNQHSFGWSINWQGTCFRVYTTYWPQSSWSLEVWPVYSLPQRCVVALPLVPTNLFCKHENADMFASGSPKPTVNIHTWSLIVWPSMTYMVYPNPSFNPSKMAIWPHSWRYPNVSSWWVIFHVVYPIAITSMVHPCRKACWNLHGTFPRVKNNQNVVVFLHGFFHGFLGCPMSEQTQIELWACREVEFMSVSMIFEIVKRGLKMIVSIFNNHESPKNGTWWLIYSLLKL